MATLRWLRLRVVASAAVLAGVAAVLLAGGSAAPAAASSSTKPAAHSSNASTQGLDVLPFPGTPDVASGTNIDFPAVSPAQIASVRVVGSRSGVHAGHLSAQPDHAGTAFSPSRPFLAGERVSVTATLRSAAAGTASGAPDARTLKFSFSIARPAHIGESNEADAGTSSGAKTHSFVTEPSFHVPWIRMSGSDADTTSGDILLDAQGSGQNAVYILDRRGRLLWYRPTGSSEQAYNLRKQRYHRQPVLTFWQGFIDHGGRGQGRDLILNSSYRVIHTITPGDGYTKQGSDQHEFTLTPQGTAFISVWSPVRDNLTSVGGPVNGTVIDYIIQEIDIATGKVVWEWQSLGHVPLRDSYAHYSPGVDFDYFHMNSIQQLPDGRILISARHTWAVYSIEKKTGKVAWELGGKHSSFKMGPHTNFEWQHDATLWGRGILTVFDDGASPAEEKQSRALEIHLSNHRATLVRAFTHSPPELARSQGSVQLLPNHNVFVGWGTAPTFSEYGPAGKQLFTGAYKAPIQSYRAYRFPWTGHPSWAPVIAVRKTSRANQYKMYMSWNGATQVARWQVLGASSSKGPFKPIRRVRWASFETSTTISTRDSYFEVQGLGPKGKLLPNGTSATVGAGS